MFPKRLVELSPTLAVCWNFWYGRENKPLRERIGRMRSDIYKVENELGLVNHRFVIRKLRRTNLLGLTYPLKVMSYIDARRATDAEVLSTFLHEGIHLRQVLDGRLKFDTSTFCLSWDGVAYSGNPIPNSCLKNYSALPWEKDVADKETAMWEKLFGCAMPLLGPKML